MRPSDWPPVWPPDRSTWGPGPWDGEPDREEWRYRGLPCLIVRNHMGAWCGYVAVPPGHPWHGRSYEAVDAACHGGLTFASACAERPKAQFIIGNTICHAPREGEPADVWWLGFDCAHSEDLIPFHQAAARHLSGFPALADFMLLQFARAYRNIRYVRQQVELLADQVLQAGGE